MRLACLFTLFLPVVAAGQCPDERDEINRSLPKWLCLAGGFRARLEGYTAAKAGNRNSDSYLLTRYHFGLSVTPTRWLSGYAELQDARAFGKDPPLASSYQSTWDLRRAQIDLGSIDQSPIALRIGRQDIAFGRRRLVGTGDWRNASRGWDAAMVGINRNRLRVRGWTASRVTEAANGLTGHQAGNNLHGIYTVIKDVIPNSVVEPFVVWRLSPGFRTEAGDTGKLDEKTIGLRWAGSRSRFDYDVEAAAQLGHISTDRIRAWACSVVLGHTFPSRFKPRVFIQYDVASGDKNPNDGIRGTFDQLYRSVHDQHGLADQVGWQNLKTIRSGIRFSFGPNWMVAASFVDWSLATTSDGFYNSSGLLVARDPKRLSGGHVGTEYDLQMSYRSNRRLEIGAGVGYMRGARFLLSTTQLRSYRYPYLTLTRTFN